MGTLFFFLLSLHAFKRKTSLAHRVGFLHYNTDMNKAPCAPGQRLRLLGRQGSSGSRPPKRRAPQRRAQLGQSGQKNTQLLTAGRQWVIHSRILAFYIKY